MAKLFMTAAVAIALSGAALAASAAAETTTIVNVALMDMSAMASGPMGPGFNAASKAAIGKANRRGASAETSLLWATVLKRARTSSWRS